MNCNVAITDGDGLEIDTFFFFTVLQFQYTPWTAAHPRSPNNILPPLCIPTHVNSHLAKGGTVATGNALTAIGCDS